MKRYIYSIAFSLGAVLLLGSAAPAMAQGVLRTVCAGSGLSAALVCGRGLQRDDGTNVQLPGQRLECRRRCPIPPATRSLLTARRFELQPF